MSHLSSLATAAGQDGDYLLSIRTVVSSLWHDLWHTAATSPWIAIALMVAFVGLLVGCTRATVRKG